MSPHRSGNASRQFNRRTLLGSGLAVASLMGLAACSTGARSGDGQAQTPGATASSTPAKL